MGSKIRPFAGRVAVMFLVLTTPEVPFDAALAQASDPGAECPKIADELVAAGLVPESRRSFAGTACVAAVMMCTLNRNSAVAYAQSPEAQQRYIDRCFAEWKKNAGINAKTEAALEQKNDEGFQRNAERLLSAWAQQHFGSGSQLLGGHFNPKLPGAVPLGLEVMQDPNSPREWFVCDPEGDRIHFENNCKATGFCQQPVYTDGHGHKTTDACWRIHGIN